MTFDEFADEYGLSEDEGIAKGPAACGRSRLSAGLCHDDGYWCLVCGRFLPADEDGVIVHDSVPHPEEMTFDEEEKPQ